MANVMFIGVTNVSSHLPINNVAPFLALVSAGLGSCHPLYWVGSHRHAYHSFWPATFH